MYSLQEDEVTLLKLQRRLEKAAERKVFEALQSRYGMAEKVQDLVRQIFLLPA